MLESTGAITAFHALQSEDRQISGNDDSDCIEHRPLHLVRGLADFLHRGPVVALMHTGKVADNIFNHHHRAIHDHAEIERAK
jgi:hypothetical protein